MTAQLKFKTQARDNDREYKVERIWDNTVCTKNFKSYLSELYYLIL